MPWSVFRSRIFEKHFTKMFCIPIQNDLLNSKMTLFLGFGSPEACKIAYEVWIFEVLHAKRKFREMAQASQGGALEAF